jgi:hypothetical protein
VSQNYAINSSLYCVVINFKKLASEPCFSNWKIKIMKLAASGGEFRC